MLPPSSARGLTAAAVTAGFLALVLLLLRCSDSVEYALASEQHTGPAPSLLPAASAASLKLNPPGEPAFGAVRLVLLSDTHTHHSELEVPDGDILIHAGDYALARDSAGRVREKSSFDAWLATLPHLHKIFVQGNHDEGKPGSPISRLQHATSLVDKLTEVVVRGRTVRIYGSPWQPQFKGWPTFLPPKDCEAMFAQIPKNLDVLITHTPMYKYGDGDNGYDAGDRGLLKAIKEKRPKLSVFGHIHDGWPRAGSVPGTGVVEGTTFINVAVTNNKAMLANPPTVYDI